MVQMAFHAFVQEEEALEKKRQAGGRPLVRPLGHGSGLVFQGAHSF